jgi:hypothetical protein
MDVERSIRIFIDDDCTIHSTEDRPSVQIHHHQDISSNFQNKNNKKINELFDDFDEDEDYDGENKTYQEKVWELTNKLKVNSTSTISSIRAGLNVRLRVPLCLMVSIPIMRPL